MLWAVFILPKSSYSAAKNLKVDLWQVNEEINFIIACVNSINAAKKAYLFRRLHIFSRTFISRIKQQPKAPVWLLYIVPILASNVNLDTVINV